MLIFKFVGGGAILVPIQNGLIVYVLTLLQGITLILNLPRRRHYAPISIWRLGYIKSKVYYSGH
jgi:hypothetical protein